MKITKVQKQVKRGYQDITCLLLQQELRILSHQIQTRHQTEAEGGYQDIPYELISMDNDSYDGYPGTSRTRRRLSSYQSVGDDHYEQMPMDNDLYEECLGRPRPRKRLCFQSIGDDHYALMPIIHNPYEASLQRSTLAPGTEYQDFLPNRKHEEGCDCYYCLYQATRDSFISFTEEERASGAERVLDDPSKITIEKPLPDGATADAPLSYPLPTGFTDVSMREHERNPPPVTDESQSRGRHLSRRRRKLRARMDRIKDYIDDDFDGDWLRLEKIREKEQKLEDANFISQLLSNVKKEPVTRPLSGFSPFTIPNFKQEEEKEAIPLSEFNFLEIHNKSNDMNDTDSTDTEKINSRLDILADHISAKDIKQIQNDQVPTPERHPSSETDIFARHITQKVIKQKQTGLVPVPERKADKGDKTFATRINVTEENNANDNKDKRCYPERNSVQESAKKSVEEHIVPAFCLAEVDFNVENSDGESDSSDYLQPVDKGNQGPDARQKLTSDTNEFCIVEVDFDIKKKDQCLESENNNNGEGSDEIQNNMFWDLCIADLNFNVPNMEKSLEPSRSLQQNVDVESTKE
jgi:hypothetical protein